MNQETWVDIKEYEGYYQVSNLGRVRSLDRDDVWNGKVFHFRKGKIRIGYAEKCGYVGIPLCKDGVSKTKRIHALMAKHFIPNPDPEFYRYVNHIDKDGSNNSLNNLEWCTNRFNTIHGDINKDSTHELLFVSKVDRRKSPYRACIRVNGKKKRKSFNNPLDAHRWATQFLDPKELITYRYNFENPSTPIEINHWNTYIKIKKI
jgi:hypothetical protein